jgi:hypothetical protein
MRPLIDLLPAKTLVAALGLSAVISIASLALAPLAIARLPADYFQQDRPPRRRPEGRRPLIHFTLTALKNVFGLFLIAAGGAMIVLPGQGLLTMVVGVGLLDFPGKHHIVNAFVRRPLVLRSLNWVRAKAHKPPFAAPATA